MRAPRDPEVRPVRRYPTPRYPGFEDPSPLDEAGARPFPYRGEFLAAVAAAGLFGATGFAADDEEPAAKKNACPFTMERSGLPYRSSPFGTGAPSYIDDDVVRQAIQRVFERNGFDLEKLTLQNSAGKFRVDGYDAEKGVGFILASWENSEDSLFGSWMAESDIDGVRRHMTDEERTALADAEAIEDATERQAAIDKALAAFHDRAISSREFRTELEEGPAKKRFVALISSHDERLRIDEWGLYEKHSAEFDEIAAIPDPAEREKAQRQLYLRLVRDQLEKFEREVEEYLRWARTQGLGS